MTSKQANLIRRMINAAKECDPITLEIMRGKAVSSAMSKDERDAIKMLADFCMDHIDENHV